MVLASYPFEKEIRQFGTSDTNVTQNLLLRGCHMQLANIDDIDVATRKFAANRNINRLN